MAGSPPHLHTIVLRRAYTQGVLKFKVEVKGHVIPSHLEFHKISLPVTQSFPNFSFPYIHSVFFRIPIPKWLWVCAVSSAIAHMVKHFVKLFAMQYGLTFCLYVRSLYEAPLHSPFRLSIRQLDLMSKSWNDLYCVIDGLVNYRWLGRDMVISVYGQNYYRGCVEWFRTPLIYWLSSRLTSQNAHYLWWPYALNFPLLCWPCFWLIS